jgi:hypothetical protein
MSLGEHRSLLGYDAVEIDICTWALKKNAANSPEILQLVQKLDCVTSLYSICSTNLWTVAASVV